MSESRTIPVQDGDAKQPAKQVLLAYGDFVEDTFDGRIYRVVGWQWSDKLAEHLVEVISFSAHRRVFKLSDLKVTKHV